MYTAVFSSLRSMINASLSASPRLNAAYRQLNLNIEEATDSQLIFALVQLVNRRDINRGKLSEFFASPGLFIYRSPDVGLAWQRTGDETYQAWLQEFNGNGEPDEEFSLSNESWEPEGCDELCIFNRLIAHTGWEIKSE